MMKICKPAIVLLMLLGACSKNNLPGEKAKTVSVQKKGVDALPAPDHIIFCWFENKGTNQIIGNANAPYINSLLQRGTYFSNAFAVTHPSYPNYIAFFAGSTLGINNDNCINNVPFTDANLYTSLKAAGKTFAWYSEDLPSTGSRICQSGRYYEKHNPTTIFKNVPKKVNKQWSSFPSDFSKLENVVCITPNIINDMHDGTVKQGDNWLRQNCSALIDWCETHNSIFVVYYDEDDRNNNNRIPVVMVGEPVKVNFQTNTQYDHYHFTRTALDLFGAACTGNACSKTAIADCWK